MDEGRGEQVVIRIHRNVIFATLEVLLILVSIESVVVETSLDTISVSTHLSTFQAPCGMPCGYRPIHRRSPLPTSPELRMVQTTGWVLEAGELVQNPGG